MVSLALLWESLIGRKSRMTRKGKLPVGVFSLFVISTSDNRDGICKKNGVWDEKYFLIQGEGRITQVDIRDDSFKARDNDPVTESERAVKQDHGSREQIAQGIAQGEAKGKTSQSEAGDHSRDIHPEGGQNSDHAEDKNGGFACLADEIKNMGPAAVDFQDEFLKKRIADFYRDQNRDENDETNNDFRDKNQELFVEFGSNLLHMQDIPG